MSTSQPQLPESEERNMTALGNILGIVIGFISPLIFWLMYKDRSAFADRNLKSALNFHLTMIIAYIVGFILTFVFIGILIIIAIGVLTLIFSILAFVKTKDGIDYKYPIAIPFIR